MSNEGIAKELIKYIRHKTYKGFITKTDVEFIQNEIHSVVLRGKVEELELISEDMNVNRMENVFNRISELKEELEKLK